jgi:hypothetical protein
MQKTGVGKRRKGTWKRSSSSSSSSSSNSSGWRLLVWRVGAGGLSLQEVRRGVGRGLALPEVADDPAGSSSGVFAG